jgi:hypothetical protein
LNGLKDVTIPVLMVVEEQQLLWGPERNSPIPKNSNVLIKKIQPRRLLLDHCLYKHCKRCLLVLPHHLSHRDPRKNGMGAGTAGISARDL